MRIRFVESGEHKAFRIFFRLLLSILVLTMFACSSPSSGGAKEAVDQFLTGLQDRDESSIVEVAPFYARLGDDQKQALTGIFNRDLDWTIQSVKQQGRTAQIVVSLKLEGNNLNMVLPLKYEQNDWKIQEDFSFTRSFDFIPAESAQ